MRQNKFFLMMLVTTMIASLLGGCGSSNSGNATTNATVKDVSISDNNKQEEKRDTVVLKFASMTTSAELTTGSFGMALQQFADHVYERTDGRYEVKLFMDSALATTADQAVGGCQAGAFEMFSLAPGSWGEYTDAFLPMNLPYLFSSVEVAADVIAGPVGARMKADVLESTGIRILSVSGLGFRQVTSSKGAIHTPEDMKNLKIRTMSDPYQIAAFQALGCAVSPIAFSELFTAMQQKLVDAQENPISTILTSKFYEVQDYMTLTNHNYAATTIAMNEDVFQSLPEDVQQILIEEGEKAEAYSAELIPQIEARMLEELSEYMEIVNLTEEEFTQFQKLVKPVWEPAKETMGDEYFNLLMTEVGAAVN